jgi:hypothetical protein
LIEACEAIERNKIALDTAKSKHDFCRGSKPAKRNSAKSSSSSDEQSNLGQKSSKHKMANAPGMFYQCHQLSGNKV